MSSSSGTVDEVTTASELKQSTNVKKSESKCKVEQLFTAS